MRAGFRVGATTPRGRAFDAYWSLLRRTKPKATRCHYWLGTDVLNTLEEAAAGTLRWPAVTSSLADLHLADAPWLAVELGSVGIQATSVPVPQPYPAPEVVPPLPAEFNVLTYLSEDRFDFYGGEAILGAARRLSDIRFDVVGRSVDPTGSAPANVHWNGWVSDMSRFYRAATVVVRIPRHDGMGATVIEGLLHARHVIYTHDVPFVHLIEPATTETLVAALAELRAEAVAGRLELNLAGRDYAITTFDRAALVGRLIDLIRAST
jgi:hypothetical protein